MDTLFLCFLIFALPYFKVFVASRVHLTPFKPTIVVKLPYNVTIVLFLFQKLHLQERILSDVVMCYFSSDDTRVRHNAAQTLVKWDFVILYIYGPCCREIWRFVRPWEIWLLRVSKASYLPTTRAINCLLCRNYTYNNKAFF
jgi:hypothetical protein